MSSIKQKIKKLMKIGIVTDSDDSISYPVVIVSFLGKVLSKAVNFSPFGVWSRPPDGSMSLLLNVNGNETNKFAITNELKKRPVKNLEKGEVVLGNLLSYFHFKSDGSLSLFINGTEILAFDTGGNMTLTGNLNVTGAIIATGVVEGSDLTDGSVPYGSHRHSDPQGGVTGPPQ